MRRIAINRLPPPDDISGVRYRTNPSPLPSPSHLTLADNRRRHGRLRCDDLVCTLGKVLDLSGSGMQLQRRDKQPLRVGAAVELGLHYGDRTLRLRARVVRIEKIGFRRYAYGLEFVDVAEQDRPTLTQLAAAASDRRCYFA